MLVSDSIGTLILELKLGGKVVELRADSEDVQFAALVTKRFVCIIDCLDECEEGLC